MWVLNLLLVIATTVSMANAVDVKLTFGNVRGSVSINSPAIGLDWWVAQDAKYGEQWGDAGILTLDLNNTKLIALAKGLSPALLRIGGSPIDSIAYDFNSKCARGSGSAGGSISPKFQCSQTGIPTYGCFTGDRWREVLAFGKATGLRLVFGLNACNGRSNPNTPLDFSNIQQLLNYTASFPQEALSALAGFEFGNEILSRTDFGVSPQQWAKDANVLATMLKTTFGAAGLDIPSLNGPDHYALGDLITEVFATLSNDTLAAFTYHDYPQCFPSQHNDGMVLQPSCLLKLDATATQAVANIGDYDAEVWHGEGADHTATGGDFGHDFLPTFQSSFYYAWINAALPLNGVPLVARQTFIGGNYGLLNKTTFEPNPDYFSAWMYRRLFQDVLTTSAGKIKTVEVNATVGFDSGLRAFAFKANVATPGTLGLRTHVLVLINLSVKTMFNVTLPQLPSSHQQHQHQHQRQQQQQQQQQHGDDERFESNTMHVQPQMMDTGDDTRYEWHLQGSPNENATTITINGHTMAYPSSTTRSGNGELWDLETLAVKTESGASLNINPASVVFVAV